MYFHSQPMEGRHPAPIRSTDYINRLTTIKKEYIRKFSNFNFEWKKTLYWNNLNNIAFFFAFFKGYRYDYLSVTTLKTKSQILKNDILHMKFSELYLCFQLIN